jgi:hypothetical protein
MTHPETCSITIVAKASLDTILSARLRDWGAPKCSVLRSQEHTARTNATGEAFDRFSRIETTVSREVARTISERLCTEFGADHSVLCVVSDGDPQTLSSDEFNSVRRERSSRELVWGDYLITI